MSTVLLDWLNAPRPGAGLHFATDDGNWTEHDYAALADAVHGLAAGLRAQGVRRGDVVCLVLPTGPAFVTGLFATWQAGGTACPIAPPAPLQDDAAYTGHVAAILAAAR